MKVAFDETGDKSLLGNNFNLAEWCDSWLTTSGVNIMEPVLEFNENESLKSFFIKQSNDLRGKNILRKHKIDVALYHEDQEGKVI